MKDSTWPLFENILKRYDLWFLGVFILMSRPDMIVFLLSVCRGQEWWESCLRWRVPRRPASSSLMKLMLWEVTIIQDYLIISSEKLRSLLITVDNSTHCIVLNWKTVVSTSCRKGIFIPWFTQCWYTLTCTCTHTCTHACTHTHTHTHTNTHTCIHTHIHGMG